MAGIVADATFISSKHPHWGAAVRSSNSLLDPELSSRLLISSPLKPLPVRTVLTASRHFGSTGVREVWSGRLDKKESEMTADDIDLLAWYWTIAGDTYPGAPSEVSPFPLRERTEVAMAAGWRGMGFVHADIVAQVQKLGMNEVKSIFARQQRPASRT